MAGQMSSKAWTKMGRTMKPVFVSTIADMGEIIVAIQTGTDGDVIRGVFADVADAQVFVLRTTNNQNLADWVALALPVGA